MERKRMKKNGKKKKAKKEKDWTKTKLLVFVRGQEIQAFLQASFSTGWWAS